MKSTIMKCIMLSCIIATLTGCKKNILDEDLYSHLAAGNFLNTPEGINSILTSSYDEIQQHGQLFEYHILVPMLSSGIGWGQGGSFEQNDAVPFANFTWDVNTIRIERFWTPYYRAIRNANIVLDNIEKPAFSNNFKRNMSAEAKAIRGYAYAHLYNLFGTVPIFTTANTEDFQLPRATNEEMLSRIETDLNEAITDLPVVQEQYAKITKGGAMSILCKHYLNTKQWQKCADVARAIIDLDVYELQEEYSDVFSIANQQNNEILFVQPSLATPSSVSNNFIAITLPPDYPLLPNQGNYAARVYIFDSFLDSFDPADKRSHHFIKEYVNTAGNLVTGYGSNKSLIFKYEPDPDGVGFGSGLDLIEIRYADILLSLAEAINEMSGPTDEAIDLINSIRRRANVMLLDVGDFSTETLRDHILKERSWELYFEGKEREDLIRHGKFISNAVARGKNADNHHILYPIPSREIDANAEIEQNPGY